MVFVVLCEQKPHPIWFSLLCVNRSPIRYGFHAVPKAVRCGVNIALIGPFIREKIRAKTRLILDEMCRLYGKFTSYVRRVLFFLV